jgi:AcrR family transcriptional regulator
MPTAASLQGKRARTRKTLIEAASAIIREKGYAHVSMEAVAARAGVSRGSIYGNFRDRNDLIAAVGAERAPRVFPAPTPGADLRTQLRAVGKTVAEAARRHRTDTIHWSTYMTYVLSDEELKRRAAEQGRLVRKMMVDAWSAALPPEATTMPVETLVKVLTTLTTGLIMAHSMSPDDFGEDVIVEAFEALAGSEGRRRKAPSPRRRS